MLLTPKHNGCDVFLRRPQSLRTGRHARSEVRLPSLELLCQAPPDTVKLPPRSAQSLKLTGVAASFSAISSLSSLHPNWGNHRRRNQRCDVIRTSMSVLKLNTRRNMEFGVILWREKCSYGQAAPNAFLAFKENPCRIGFACMCWGYLHARVIALDLLYAYIESRHCRMRRHLRSRGGNYCVILIGEYQ